MTSAPQLELFRAAPDDPNVAWFTEFLFVNGPRSCPDRVGPGRAGWLTAAKILELVPQEIKDAVDFTIDDRRIRMWAEAAAPKIISGQHGYKHTDHATADEIKTFVATMESQGTKMLARANKVRTYTHAKIG